MSESILAGPSDEAFDRRIAMAYATALEASHKGGTVYVAAGTAVLDYLQSVATVEVKDTFPNLCDSLTRLWGFPLVAAEPLADPDHLSVRTMMVIA